MSDEKIKKILNQKKSLADKVLILAHHYQAPEIIKCADVIGDSYMLAVKASKLNVPYIIMCGVRFMGQSVRTLASDNQTVVMPDVNAGCPMADMVDLEQATKAFEILQSQCRRQIVPVVYMNSYSDMKHFCGVRGGSVCTSSNASMIVDYYLKRDKTVFFFPDYNLGANTALDLGVFDKTAQIHRDFSVDGDVGEARMLLWDGFCPRHKVFRPSDIERVKPLFHDAKIIVHPECSPDVVKMSDLSGSTEKIKNVIEDSPAGSSWIVGTESNFVLRIAENNRDKKIVPLKVSFCTNMSLTTLDNLSDTIDNIEDHIKTGAKLNGVLEDETEFKTGATEALNKMIEITEHSDGK